MFKSVGILFIELHSAPGLWLANTCNVPWRYTS